MALSDIINALTSRNEQIDQTASQLQSAYGAEAGAYSGVADSLQQLGNANSAVVQQKGEGELAAQENSRRFASAAGTNMDINTQVMSLLGKRQREAALSVAKQQDKVAKIDANSGLSNPLGLIYDLFWGDEERAKLKSSEEALKSTSDAIAALNASTQTVARTQQAIAKTQTEESVSQLANAERLKADVQAKQAQAKVASTNVAMLRAVDSLHGDQMSNLVRGYDLQAREDQRQYMNELREEARQQKKDSAAVDTQMMKDYNAAADFLGKSPVQSKQDWNVVKAMTKKEDLASTVSIGHQINSRGSLVQVAATPYDALVFAQQNPAANLSDAQKQMLSQINGVQAKLNGPDGPKMLVDAGLAKNEFEAKNEIANANKKVDTKRSLLNTIVMNSLSGQVSSYTPSDDNNFYSLPPIESLQGKQLLDTNEFLKTYVKPATQSSGATRFDPNHWANVAVQAIQKGDVSPVEAAQGIANFVSALHAQNLAVKNFTTFGIPDIDAYLADVTVDLGADTKPQFGALVPGGFLGAGLVGHFSRTVTKEINMEDPSDWNTLFVSALAKATGGEMSGRSFFDQR